MTHVDGEPETILLQTRHAAPDAYMQEMARRERLIVVSEQELPWTFVTFFVLRGWEEEQQFHDRPQWTTPPDCDDGALIYVDMLGGLVWNRRVFRQVEAIIAQRVPRYRWGVWYHVCPTGEKRYTLTRRLP